MTPYFKSEIAEILDVEEQEISLTFALDDSNWDSLAKVTTAALIDEVYSKIVDAEELSDCKSLNELMLLIKNS